MMATTGETSPRSLAAFLEGHPEATSERDGNYVVRCPAHADGKPSLVMGVDPAGKLLLHCRAGCAKDAVLAALGWTWADLTATWTAGDLGELATTAEKGGPTDEEVDGLRTYEAATAHAFSEYGAEAARFYALSRWGISEADANALGIGYDDGSVGYRWASPAFHRAPRLTVPFRDFDGRPLGLQGRALQDDPLRWCGLTNPAPDRAWSKVAVFDPGTGLDYCLVTEGPGDGLAAYAAGFMAVAVRGAALGRSSPVRAHLAANLSDRRVVVCGDADTAGAAFSSELGHALAEAGLDTYVLAMPEGIGDLSDWYEADPAGFPSALERAVRSARRVSPPSAPTPGQPDEDEEDEGPSYAMTDLGNAERLHAHLRGLVRFIPEHGFYLWRGTHWSYDAHDSVRTAAQAVTKRMVEEGRERLEAAEGISDATRKATAQEAAKRLMAWGQRSQSTGHLTNMVKELAALPGVSMEMESMDRGADLLTVANGTVDLRTGTLLPHRPEDLITRMVPFAYRPEAECPRWVQFLSEVFPDHPEMDSYLQKLVGYGITGHTSEQAFAILWGRGANGKSVFLDTLRHVFNPVTSVTPFSTFEQRPSGGIPNDLAALKGARLVMASESENGARMAEATLKKVTGQDAITARFLNREFFTFYPTFLILLATNHKPSFRGQDEGLWRRVKLIPFQRYFTAEERDHYLQDKLKDEAEGILAWAVQGAVAWYARRAETKASGLDDPGAVKAATEGYRETSDELAGFFPGWLVPEPGAMTLGKLAYQSFVDWSHEEGVAIRGWSSRAFYGALEERGLSLVKKERGKTIVGARLLDASEREAAMSKADEPDEPDEPDPTLVRPTEGTSLLSQNPPKSSSGTSGSSGITRPEDTSHPSLPDEVGPNPDEVGPNPDETPVIPSEVPW